MTRNLNPFMLIGLGVTVASLYSLVVIVAPQLVPTTFRDAHGEVGLHFEAAAVIVTLVLPGQWLELRERSATSNARRVGVMRAALGNVTLMEAENAPVGALAALADSLRIHLSRREICPETQRHPSE